MDKLTADLGAVVDKDHRAPRSRGGAGRGKTRRPRADHEKVATRVDLRVVRGGRLSGSTRPSPAMPRIAPSKVSQRGQRNVL